MSVYQGDKNLETLLKQNNSPYSVSEVKAIIKGVLSAPVNEANPNIWHQLVTTNDNAGLSQELNALKENLYQPTSDSITTESVINKRLQSLRAEFNKQSIDGFIVPRADEFQGEYVPAGAERLAWITGFVGSAGSAVVLTEKAGFFTDGRYTLAARQQVPSKLFNICSISPDQGSTPTITPTQWVEQNLPKGGKLAYDPWLHTEAQITLFEDAVKKAGGTLVPVTINPLDAAWSDQPSTPITPVQEQELKFSGKTSHEKRQELATFLVEKKCQATAISLPEDIAWLLNIRGGDVPCTPLPLSFAIAHDDGTVDLFIDQRKLPQTAKQALGKDIRLHDFDQFVPQLEKLGQDKKTVLVDPGSAPVKINQTLETTGATVVKAKAPCQLPKALKNKVEIEGTIEAHIRDGVALTRFLSRLSDPNFVNKNSEMSAADTLHNYRTSNDNFRGLSFDTISGAGGNGAIVHYRVTKDSDTALNDGPVYLVDSGAQYLDGTTDVTRTVGVSPEKITPEMRDRFTRVLKGHIQVATAIFPKGTNGKELDKKARAPLQEIGLDFAHGTGHGVGSYLSVHEGPQGIHPRAETPLQPGMIVSNEPGYYKEGEYGIRIENLVTVEDTGKKDHDGKPLYQFKTLTMAPIDHNLIDITLLNEEELKWLNSYHDKVKSAILPRLKKIDAKAAQWLVKATQALDRGNITPIRPKPPTQG